MSALFAAGSAHMRLILLVFAVSAIEVASGQYRIDQGRPLDANSAIGGTRFNDSVPYQPLLGGNLTATGNIRGGLALRSFSPIGDPTGFRAGLGSSSLSGFLRDSVSVADRGSSLFTPTSIAGRTFFDPSVTAPTAAYLTGTGE